ncbi:hypothetical protein SDC9_61441 [bioreactor metagenome]|uniref:Methyl-accepting chemotaxis protein III n=1 Tax=bioreactor metagenome TaxID=1076179 RepID=A0A644XFS7_9ZZZZ
MKNFSIAKKLTLSFGIIILLYIATILCSLFIGLKGVTENFTGFYNGPYRTAGYAHSLRRQIQGIQKDMAYMVLETDLESLKEINDDLNVRVDDFSKTLDAMNQALILQENKDKVALIQAGAAERKEIRSRIIALCYANDIDGAYQILKAEYTPASQEVTEILRDLNDSVSIVADEYYDQANSSAAEAFYLILILFGVSAAIAVGLCVYIIRGIRKPLAEVEHAVTQLSHGNFNVDVRYQSRDEMGAMANSIRSLIQSLKEYIENIRFVLGKMSDGDMTVTVDIDYQNDFAPIKEALGNINASMNDTLCQIQISAEQVASGSQQVATGSQLLAQGATEQASSVEELAATMAEISNRIHQASADANKARGNMNDTADEIRDGESQMRRLVAAMSEISSTSNEIQKIVRTIDDIAFQTNILALNAAVEAARAGSAGRGFAVVAEEVRNLASKSAQAAKNTTDLIENTISAVQNGSRMVNDTKVSLDKIAAKANDVSLLVSEIASSMSEQAGSIKQVNIGVEQISNVVQTNSATAEESSAASEELSGQAQTLQGLVARFRLTGTSPSHSSLPSMTRY